MKIILNVTYLRDKQRNLWIYLVITSIYISIFRSSLLFNLEENSRLILGIIQLFILIATTLMVQVSNQISSRIDTTKYLFSFGALALISIVWSIDVGETLLQSMALWVVILFIVTTGTKLWKTHDRILNDIDSVALSLFPILGLGLILYTFNVRGSVGDYGRITGILNNANYAGMLASILLIFSLNKLINRPLSMSWSGLIFITAGATLILSGSRGSIIATCVSFIALLAMNRSMLSNIKILSLYVAISVALSYLIFNFRFYLIEINSGVSAEPGQSNAKVEIFSRAPGADISSGRRALWNEAFENWQSRPFLGSGFGTSQELNGALNFTPHNLFLLILVELGAVGAFIALLLVYRSIKYQSLTNFPVLTAAALGIFVLEIFEASFFGVGGPTSTLMWLIIFGWISARIRVKDSLQKLE